MPAPPGASCAVCLYHEEGSLGASHAMERRPSELGDIFVARVDGLRPGDRYRYRLGDVEVSDPYARFLPDGVHGPALIPPEAPPSWRSAPLGVTESVGPIYEMHIGTFTPEGTYGAAASRLPDLVALGIGAVELMPVGAFAGQRGWGYDTVAHYAPFAPYGTPDDLAAFVDRAHALGVRVLLDVVYNHFGPDGNYLRSFAPGAFTSRFADPWGESPDFRNPFMRAYVLDNVRYWLEDFRFDGLRLDATHAIHDDGPIHILREIADVAHSLQPRRFVVAEDERNEPRLVHDFGIDAIWADDMHHQLHVALTGEHDGYYAAYEGGTAAIAHTIEAGWSYTGQTYAPWGAPRGRPATDLDAWRFVYALQNHDQTGNRARGERLTAISRDVDAFGAASLVLLLLPMTPLLFMGQEWAASSPFLYFTDHEPILGRAVTEGRRKEFAHFDAFRDPVAREAIPDPQARSTFEASRLDWDERTREPHASTLELYTRLLRLRAQDPVLRDRTRASMSARNEGGALVIDRASGGQRRRIIANLTGHALSLPEGLTRGWRSVLWSQLTSAQQPLPCTTWPKSTAALLEPAP